MTAEQTQELEYIITGKQIGGLVNESKVYRELIVRNVCSRPYTVPPTQDAIGACPQNKVWRHCPVAEQTRKDEREKVLGELRKEIVKRIGMGKSSHFDPDDDYIPSLGVDELSEIIDALQKTDGE